MYLYTRSVRPGPGNPGKQLDWALRMTEKVNQISETPVSLWTTVFSPSAGQFVWSSTFEDLLTIETTFEKLIGDNGYTSLVEEGGTHASGDPVDDSLLQFLFVDPKAADTDSKYAGVIRTTAAPGGLVKGMELGVETAQLAGKITGSATSFASGVTGPYGMVEWITLYASIEDVQRSENALAADAGFAQKVDKELSKVYLPGAAEQLLLRRIV
jgi:hypothetical protein